MDGFLGTRGDFFSDLLILALAVVLPALAAGVWAARTGRRKLHRALMLGIVGLLIGYVAVFETNLMRLGGTDYLAEATPMARTPYLVMLGGHVLIGVVALVIAVWAAKRGSALMRDRIERSVHARMGWRGVGMLSLSAITGVVVYWTTFVM